MKMVFPSPVNPSISVVLDNLGLGQPTLLSLRGSNTVLMAALCSWTNIGRVNVVIYVTVWCLEAGYLQMNRDG